MRVTRSHPRRVSDTGSSDPEGGYGGVIGRGGASSGVDGGVNWRGTVGFGEWGGGGSFLVPDLKGWECQAREAVRRNV